MNLLQLRAKFLDISGRVDLVNDDGTDNGADFYINEGRKYLDRLDEHQKSWASQFRFIEIGRYSASVKHCRAIKEVWIATTSERWQLEKKNIQDIISEYMTTSLSERDTGTPLYYSPTITRYNPNDIIAADFESFIGWIDIPSGGANEFNTILLNVPISERMVVEVKGLFYSPSLDLDTDENYWSSMHPLLLIMSAMRYIEITNRNTQGVNDWTNSIMEETRQIGMDLVEELIAGVNQMEG